MRLKTALATVALALFGATVANAQVTFTLSPSSNGPITPGANFALEGLILNDPAGSTVNYDGSSFTVPAGIGVIDNFNSNDLSLTSLPLTLAPGDSFSLDPFLELVIPAGFPGGT